MKKTILLILSSCLLPIIGFTQVAVGSSTICVGQSTTLTASGATSYTWSNGSTTNSIIVSPNTTTTYTVVGTNSGTVTSSAIATIVVNALPVINVNAPSICLGSAATLLANGATSYTWNTGANTASINASPNVTSTYTVYGTNANGCVNTKATAITVNTPTIIVNTPTICAGQTTTLNVSGAVSYTYAWTTNTITLGVTTPVTFVSINTPTIVSSLLNTATTYTTISNNINGSVNTNTTTTNLSTTYTITGTDMNGCVNTTTATIIINQTPTLTALSNVGVCTTTLSAAGNANNYNWLTPLNPPVVLNAGIIAYTSPSGDIIHIPSPLITTTYVVVGTIGTCTSIASVTVQITDPNPCRNGDFESGTTCLWNTIQSAGFMPGNGFATTPGADNIIPSINTSIGSSSGCVDAINGAFAPFEFVQMSRTFIVPSNNFLFAFDAAVITESSPNHGCGGNARVDITVTGAPGIQCGNINLIASAGGPCSVFPGWINVGGANGNDYLPWATYVVPVNGALGMPITLTVRATRCNSTGHGARAYVDVASCNPLKLTHGLLGCPATRVTPSTTTTLGLSTLAAGTIYTWQKDGALIAGANTNTINIESDIHDHLYRLNVTLPTGCQFFLDTLIPKRYKPQAILTATNNCIGKLTEFKTASVELLGPPTPTTTIVSEVWNFNDGTATQTIVPTNNLGIFQTSKTHSYTAAGTYTVNLLVTDSKGCKHDTDQVVVIYPNPVANFTANAICSGTATAFTDLSTVATGTVTNWDWDFTNNNSYDNNLQQATTIYPASGTYTSMLRVTTSFGCMDSITFPVNVWGRTIPDFTPDKVCYGTANTFTNLTNTTTNANLGTISSYNWAFGDGVVLSSLTNPMHTYTLGGNTNASYQATLTATTSHACVDFKTKQVDVFALPTASFSTSPVCFKNATQFTDASNGNGNTLTIYKWDYTSDGSVDLSGIATHAYIFPFAGNHLTSYTVASTPAVGLTCSTSTVNTVTVYPKPVAKYEVNPNPSNVVTPLVYFSNQSQGYIKWWWVYGDNSPRDSVSVDPSHFYESVTADTYNSVLLLENQFGCKDTFMLPVNVGPEFVFYMPNAFTPSNDDGTNELFTGKGIGIDKFEMWIYDRWGEQVYYTDEITKGWDGQRQGKNKEAKQDVFTWKVAIKDVLGKKHDYVGHVTLLK